jgi:hypothetical protein
MSNQNLNQEQKITKIILYIILSLTIIVSYLVDFYTLVNPKYRYLINIFMLGIYGIVFYIGYKKQLINKISSIVSIIIVALIFTFTLLNR